MQSYDYIFPIDIIGTHKTALCLIVFHQLLKTFYSGRLLLYEAEVAMHFPTSRQLTHRLKLSWPGIHCVLNCSLSQLQLASGPIQA